MSEVKKSAANDELVVAVSKLENTSQRIRYLMAHFSKEKSAMGATTRWLRDNGYRTAKGTEIRFQHVRNTHLQQLKKK